MQTPSHLALPPFSPIHKSMPILIYANDSDVIVEVCRGLHLIHATVQCFSGAVFRSVPPKTNSCRQRTRSSIKEIFRHPSLLIRSSH